MIKQKKNGTKKGAGRGSIKYDVEGMDVHFGFY